MTEIVTTAMRERAETREQQRGLLRAVPEDFVRRCCPVPAGDLDRIENRDAVEDVLRSTADETLTDAAREVLEDRALALARDHAYRILSSSSTNIDAAQAAMTAIYTPRRALPTLPDEQVESVAAFLALATTADFVAQDDYTDPAVQRMIEHVRRLDG